MAITQQSEQLAELLHSPSAPDHATWFRSIAHMLLHSTLWVGEQPHAIAELEFYYSDPTADHVDPFIHGDPLQRGCATWYLHRQGISREGPAERGRDRGGPSYRGGTYKGIDLTFGPAHAHGGILLRSLRAPSGALICGSSLCVDHLLAQTGHSSVAALAQVLGQRSVVEADMPLRIEPAVGDDSCESFATARVGLTLRRVDEHPRMIDYVARRYRYLNAPREIAKGRIQLAIALYESGRDAQAIAAMLGSPKRSIAGWIAAYEQGRTWTDTRALWGAALDSLDLCRLLGALAPHQ